MSTTRITSGQYAMLEVTDPELVKEIHDRLASNHNDQPEAEYRPEEGVVALVFSDTGEVKIGVSEHRDTLDAVKQAGGRCFVQAKVLYESKERGGPIDPPPPDLICPC